MNDLNHFDRFEDLSRVEFTALAVELKILDNMLDWTLRSNFKQNTWNEKLDIFIVKASLKPFWLWGTTFSSYRKVFFQFKHRLQIETVSVVAGSMM